MFKVRHYNKTDFPMISEWWNKHKEMGPTEEMLPEESTFICELNGTPLTAITLYLTNSKEFCMLDNFIGNPAFRGEDRKEASKLIIEYAENLAKDLGYKSIFCMALNDSLSDYYEFFGYKKRLNNVSTLNKEL
jgi:hypothetical protein